MIPSKKDILMKSLTNGSKRHLGFRLSAEYEFGVAAVELIEIIIRRFHNHYTQKDYTTNMKNIEVPSPSLFKLRWFSR